jgi:hypothetical protein
MRKRLAIVGEDSNSSRATVSHISRKKWQYRGRTVWKSKSFNGKVFARSSSLTNDRASLNTLDGTRRWIFFIQKRPVMGESSCDKAEAVPQEAIM